MSFFFQVDTQAKEGRSPYSDQWSIRPDIQKLSRLAFAANADDVALSIKGKVAAEETRSVFLLRLLAPCKEDISRLPFLW
jgi:hypothetical protein